MSAQEGLFSPFHRVVSSDAIASLTYPAPFMLAAAMEVAVGTPEQNTTTFTYNANGNLITTTDPLNNTATLTYDAAGNVQTSNDALNRTTTFAYDPMNRLTQVTDAAGGITQYAYNGKGNLTSVTDAKGHTTTFEYNEVDQPIKTTNPLGQSKTFTYDLARNLLLVVDAKGQRIEFTYDAGNQLVQKVLKDSGGAVTDTATFGYDTLGNLASVTDNDSGLAFTYDALSRLTQAQTSATVAQPATTITYSYDKNAKRLTMTDPQSENTTYIYDALNRLTTLISPDGSAGTFTTTFTYDALSRRTVLNLPNGVSAALTYDAASQLLSLVHQISGNTVASFSYAYDGVGNRTGLTDLDGPHNFVYDILDRLTQATHPQPTNPPESFIYDMLGNRTSSHLATGQIYDAANRLLGDSGFTYTYDANGNLESKTDETTGEVTTYTYDVENRLIRVDATGLVAQYRYDPQGRRIDKDVNGVITRYVYDNEDILLEFNGTNVVQARYTHGPDIDEPLIMLRGGQSLFYHADGLGTITTLTDFGGTVARTYVYDGFGRIVAQTGTVTNPYTYTGREFDPESGLYYYRERYYEPTIGRFLQEDPLGLLGSSLGSELNQLYVYVANNPLTAIDPTGLEIIILGLKCGSGWPNRDVMKKLECNDKCNGSLPIFILSGWRSATQNTCAKGVEDSPHLTGRGADIFVPGLTPAEVAGMASGCTFKGISTYDPSDPSKSGYTHVDIRPQVWNAHNGDTIKDGVPEWRTNPAKCSCNSGAN